MKIHRDIRKSHQMLILAQAGLRVKRDCQGTRHYSFSLSKLYNKIFAKSQTDIIPKSLSGNHPEFLEAGDIHHSSMLI